MILGTYDPTYGELLEDQWLLKLREDIDREFDGKKWIHKGTVKTGFLTKLTKKGELPKPFVDWGGTHHNQSGKDLPIYVFQEDFRTGWKLLSWRFGMSQNWARMKHPEGFVVEIYLDDFLKVVKESTMIQGVILDAYKWKNNSLIRKI